MYTQVYSRFSSIARDRIDLFWPPISMHGLIAPLGIRLQICLPPTSFLDDLI